MQKFLPFLSTICMFFFFSVLTVGQSLDSIRQVARDGNYSKARELCRQRNDYEENTDILFLEGQTFWWEGRTSEAKKILENVLEQNPQHIDAISTLTAVEVANENYNEAIRLARNGLQLEEKNEDLIYYIALANAELGQLKTASRELDELFKINPQHKKGLELKQSLDVFKIPGAIALYQSVQWFNDPYERYFYTTTMEAPIGDKEFKIIPRLNFGILDRADVKTSGSQAGIDFYPLTGAVSYMYIHYAYSDAEIYPAHRSAVEWYSGLGEGWEVSAGGRYLYWDDHIYFFSASTSKYIGQWMPGVRLFYSPDGENNISALGSIRRYLNDSRSYIHMYIGYGNNPDRSEKQIELKEDSDMTRLTGGAYSIFGIGGSFYARLLAEYNMEEQSGGEWRDVFMLQAGIEYKF